MLIDSHCHLHDKEFYSAKKAEECLKRAHEKGVEKIICIGTSHEDSLKAAEFAKEYKNVYWTYGIHPEYATSNSDFVLSSAGLKKSGTSYTGRPGEPSPSETNLSASSGIYVPDFLNHFMLQKEHKSESKKLVAIGEVGLDYHYDDYDRKAQIKLFEQMLQLAKDLDLPLSFHIRDAFSDFFGVIENFPKARGVVHSFTGSKRVLKRILEQTDFYIGVNGLATYSTLPMPPLERILLETDAPFLAPKPVRGETNEPSHIFEIAEWLAGALDVDFETIEKATAKNTEKLFKI